MKILVPRTITDAMLVSSTVAEPAAGETLWVAAAAYVLGDLRIRVETHRVYECTLEHTGRAALPEVDERYWLDKGPTLRWAMLDTIISTPTTGAGPLTVVLSPGFFNALAFYGLDGAQLLVSVKDGPGGAVTYPETAYALQEPPLDYYDWCFGEIRTLSKLVIEDFLPYPNAELTLTFTGATASVGIVAIGDMRSILGDATEEEGWGADCGATAEPVTNSYIKKNIDGTAQIVRRPSGTDMRVTVTLPRDQSSYALALMQQVLDVPACFIATEAEGCDGLNVFGLASGSLAYSDFVESIFTINVMGLA